VFHEGDPARHFFILVRGCVRLTLGEAARPVYTSSRVGEIFGWSSLIGRASYSASAQCLEDTVLLKIDRQRFLRILEKDSFGALTFYRQLSEALGDRLLFLYSHGAEAESVMPATMEEVQP
jgi:CRP-like cAMP-binding protein